MRRFNIYEDFNTYSSYTSGMSSLPTLPKYQSNQNLVEAYKRQLLNIQDQQDLDRKVANELPSNRSMLDRVFDGLQIFNYASAGFMDGLADGKGGRNPFVGAWEGIKAGNPFGKGFEEGETTYSDVLDTLGWRPEGTAGKIARGTVGFIGDVLLDPSTYLTGGASAVIKGTGKVGASGKVLADMTDTIAKQKYTDEIGRLQKEAYGGKKLAVSNDMVQQAKSVENAFRESAKHGMTQEMAETIVRSRVGDGAKLASGSVEESANRLAKEFNRALGMRNAGRVSWGIGNLPFMPRKYQHHVIDLGSDAGLRRMSDKLGISKGYAKLRNFVYGSWVGKAFSSTTPLYRMAKEDPEKLWETLEWGVTVRGMNSSLNDQKRLIQERFKSFNLTPAENAEVLKLLQDKTVWSKIAEKVKFSKLETAQSAAKLLREEADANKLKLDELVEKRANLETFRSSFDDDMVDAEDLYGIMQKQYRDDILSIELKHVESKSDLEKVMKMYDDEIKGIEETLKRLNPVSDDSALEELYKLHQSSRKAHNVDMSHKGSNEALDGDIKLSKAEQESQVSKEVIQRFDGSVGKEDTFKLIDALSHRIYGENRRLPRTLNDNSINQLMKMIRDGEDVETIQKHIAKHPEDFASHVQDMNSYIATELGYTDWNWDGYRQPLGKLLGKSDDEIKKASLESMEMDASMRYHDGVFTPQQRKTWLRLQDRKEDREIMRAYYSSLSEEEFITHIARLQDEQIMDEIGTRDYENFFALNRQESADMRSSRRRGSSKDTQRAWNRDEQRLERTPVEREDTDFSLFGKENDVVRDPYLGNARMDGQERYEALMDIAGSKMFEPHVFAEAMKDSESSLHRYINRLVNEVDEFSIRELGRRYPDLTDKQKSLAIWSSAENISTQGGFGKKLKDSVEVMAKKRAYDQMIDSISKEVTIGHEIRFVHPTEKSLYRGEIVAKRVDEAGNTVFDAKVPTSGEVIEDIMAKHVRNVKTNKANLSASDILKGSRIAESELARKEVLTKQLSEATAKLTDVDNTYKELRERSIKEWETRLEEQRNVMLDLEEQGKLYDEMKREVDDDAFLELHSKIQENERLLNDSEAFETYVRTNEAYREALGEELAQQTTAGKVWLEDIASSDKVAHASRELRRLFDNIGKREIKAGLLTQEQFDGLLNQYVPHILTRGGRKFFKAYKDVNDATTSVTRDFGFGVKYNPHSKSRTIKGKTLEEINEHFRTMLKGKNLFSENVADVYLSRAMTHVDSMYDDYYMRNMLETFGKNYKPGSDIEDGYKLVMNHGMLKETMHDVASMNLSSHISNNVSEYISQNYAQFRQFAIQSNRSLDDVINSQVDDFLKKTYNDEVVGDLWESYIKKAKKDSEMPNGILDSDATPMTEITPAQGDKIMKAFQDAYNEQNRIIRNSRERLERLGGTEAEFNKVMARFEKLDKRTPPQIKQVNENIVLKANQARKIQQTKDQHAFLRLYDKFTHIVKLNQTIVMPSFHTRNKMGNMFQSWLGVGRDAVNVNYQTAATLVAHYNGDFDAINRVIQKGGKVSEAFEPIRVASPHESLTPYLSDGQLTWENVHRIAKDYGGIDEGFAHADVGLQAGTRGLSGGSSLDPTNTEGFALYKAGSKVGGLVENTDRMIHIMSRLKDGHSIEDAIRSSREFLFDYSDLTMFEKNVMKRIFPYYTWLRKNARLQVSQLLENPEKYRTIAKVTQGIQGMTDREDQMLDAFVSPFAQDWIQTPFVTVDDEAIYDEETGELIKQEVTRPILFSPNMPYMDFNRIPNPMSPIDSAVDLFTQTNPLIKNPIELLTNTNAFFGSDIVRDDEKALGQNARHLATQLGLYNVVEGMFNKEGIDLGLHAVNSVTGVKTLAYDYERNKNMEISEFFRNGGSIDGETFEDRYKGIEERLEKLKEIQPQHSKAIDRYLERYSKGN